MDNRDDRLPKCPRCGSQLSYSRSVGLIKLILGAESHFYCEFCGWKKTKKQVQMDGGLGNSQQFCRTPHHGKGFHTKRKNRRFQSRNRHF
jgi:hypothetical protein